MIRADLDQKFMETKRNKLLWELLATKMKELGYNRSPDQCKCKWKNLVTRYKGCETMGSEEMKQQFSFYSEVQSIFGARMERMIWMEADDGAGGSKQKVTLLSSDEEDENEDSDLGDKKAAKSSKKRKVKCSTSTTNNSNVKEILDDFMKQQKEMEMRWFKAMEAREQERKMMELEWRQRLEALETEKMMIETKWREREEEWRMREEARAQKRDALMDTLLQKLLREDRN
ncbi:hypothetical protein ACET3Z_019560 [Daucus carota]